MTTLAPLLSAIVSLYLLIVAISLVVSDAIAHPIVFHATALVGGVFDVCFLMGAVVVHRIIYAR